MPAPTDCTSGIPKAGQPTYFQFDVATVAEALGLLDLPGSAILSWLSLQVLGVPVGAISTNQFCSLPPSGPFATTEDYALIGFPALAMAAGTYDRLRNSYYASEWAARCLCAPANPDVPPSPVVPSGTVEACQTDPPSSSALWQSAWLPSDTMTVTVTLLGISRGGVPVPLNHDSRGAWFTFGAVLGSNPPQLGGETGALEMEAIGQTKVFDFGAGNGVPCVLQFVPAGYALPGTCWQFAWSYHAASMGKPYTAPTPPPHPTDMPSAPSCPPIATLQDVGDELCKLTALTNVLDGKLQYLASLAMPATSTPEPVPTPAPAGAFIGKPLGAIGVVVELTSIPAKYAHYGDPAYYPGVGHVIMQTPDGMLGSVELKHNPLVVFFPNQQVEKVALDLSADVVGQVRFLIGPK
ncbi:MAG TPA: hypothetical protein VGQ62_12960 [Chloroflexota bacterium]|nr:hypothetical protein [Chloroflexota bacterium]